MVIQKRELFDVSGYRIEVVEADEMCEAYLQDRSPSQPLVVGLDCEWCSGNQRPGSPNVPVALLQLAFPDGECLLVRLCKIRKVTPALEKLLTDKRYMTTQGEVCLNNCTLLKMGRYYSTTMCHYWDVSVKIVSIYTAQ